MADRPLGLDRTAASDAQGTTASAASSWVLSFADMILLLMCLFVFLYSVALSDAARFRDIVSGLRSTFGDNSEAQPTVPAAASAAAAATAAQRLRNAFATEIDSGLIDIREHQDSLTIRMGDAGAFASGDATLTSMSLSLVSQVAQIAKDRHAQLIIGGHTDNVPVRGGRYRDNWELSAARAIAVVRELVEHQAVEPALIQAQGFADTHPVASNDLPYGRALNRRIEIDIRF